MEVARNTIDVLCVGDTVVEPFIHLLKAEVHCKIDNSNCTITLPFGSKIPFSDDNIAYGVGNSANASVSVARLGLKSALATEIGKDDNGKKCIENFNKEKVDTSLVGEHIGIQTNYHYVLWYPPDRTILVKHNSFPRKLDIQKWNKLSPKYLYLSSLPEDSLQYHNEIANWLKVNRATKLVFQPGTFQMKLGIEAMKDFYTHCHLYVVNKEEAQYILNTEENSLQILLESLQKLGPEIVCVTDGPNGAYMRSKDVSGIYKNYFIPIYPDPKPPLERTGCGDAFASTFTAALAMGKTALEALTYAPINSMNVVQEVGAQKGLLTLSEIETYLRNKPDSYKVIEI